MPRRPRIATGGLAYHVLNRRVGRLPLFEKPADYAAFEKILQEAHTQTRLRIAAYCLMPNTGICCSGLGRMANYRRSCGGLRLRIPGAGMRLGIPLGQVRCIRAASSPFRCRPTRIS